MKFVYNILLVAVLMAFFPACTDNFGEINSNPNAPETVPGDLLLPTIIIDPARRMLEGNAWELGNTASQIGAVNNFTTFDQMGWGSESGTWSTIIPIPSRRPKPD